MNYIRMKRYLAVALPLILMLTLTACAKPQTGPAAETAATPVETETGEEKAPRIAVSIYRFDDDFMTLYRNELKRYLRENYQAEVTVADAEGSQAVQKEQISRFLEQGYDALIVNPVLFSKTGEIADRCMEAGVPVVFINRRPDPAEIRRWEDEKIPAAYVGTDEKQSGIYQGEIILDTPDHGDINGDGTISYVMIGGGIGSLAAEYRSSYPIRALEDGGFRTECLFKESGNWDRDEGKALAARALEEYGDRIEVIFCNNDAMANGALEAIRGAGRRVGGDIYLVGVDALEETVKSIREGTITGTVFNDYNTQAHTAADVAMKLIKGEKTEKEYNIDFIKVPAGKKDIVDR